MPRQARIDAPGALHHIVCRGIERRWIFREDADRDNFVERLGFLIKESKTPCYAWALLQNHFHLLLRTGTVPISILAMFAEGESEATMKYRDFLNSGIRLGRRPELTGGGLIRSAGGWQVLKSQKRMRAHLKGDERILGDSDFVNNVLKEAAESMERKYKLKAEGADFGSILRKVAAIFNIDERNLLTPGKDRLRSQARSLLCYMAAKELGESATKTAEKVGMSQSAVSKAVRRGEIIARHYGCHIFGTEKS